MNYRKLGNTGLTVSELGMGCEGFIGKDEAFTNSMFALALSHGVNCMDMYSPEPDMQRRVGKAIHNDRERFILQAHLCTLWRNEQYEATRRIDEVRASFELLLKNLDTDYIDIGLIHYIDSMDTWREVAQGDVFKYALAQKAAGRIRHIGISSHNPLVALEAVNSGLIEVLLFSINPCYDLLPGTEDCEDLWSPESYAQPLFNLDPAREQLYEACQRKGVGITVMKAFGGGDLLSAKNSPAAQALTPLQCLHYALTRPGVGAVMAGVRSLAELEDTLSYETASDAEKDYAAAFAAFPKISWKGHCMYCGHCAPCPKGIDVASVTKFLNLAKAQGTLPETVREHYAALTAHASDCIRCASCEKRCPFGVPVMENMREAREVFGK